MRLVEKAPERAKKINRLTAMLKKEFRLRKSKEIERAAKGGRSIFVKDLGIKYLINNLPVSRFAVVVSLKVHKKATKRNKVKRQIREIVRLNLPKIKRGFDLLIIAKPLIVGKKYQEIEEEILEVLRRNNLLIY